MSAPDNLERLVAEWLTAAAPTSAPGDAHADLMTAVRRSRQHPRWLAKARHLGDGWLSGRCISPAVPHSSLRPWPSSCSRSWRLP